MKNLERCKKNIRDKSIWRLKNKSSKYGTIKFSHNSSLDSGSPLEREVDAMKHLIKNYYFDKKEQLLINRVGEEELEFISY